MLSDIEIINQSKLEPIDALAGKFGISADELFHYGKYIAKVEPEVYERLAGKKDGKLILVTAITPTPAGEENRRRRSDWWTL